MENLPFLLKVLIYATPVIVAITFHEAAHGYVALRYGDDTALRMGRISLNPFRHVDLFGTIILPGLLIFSGAPFLFGYAKPVPVNFSRLDNPRRDMILVAAAGPAMNILLAITSAFLMRFLFFFPEMLQPYVMEMFRVSLLINVVLAVFNMLPLPPLDGGRVAVGLLPDPLALPLARLERWGILILLGALIVLPLVLSNFGVEFNLFYWLLGGPIETIVHWIALLTGI